MNRELLSRNMKAFRGGVATKNNGHRTQPKVYSFTIHTKNTENGESSVTWHSDLTKEFFSSKMSGGFTVNQ